MKSVWKFPLHPLIKIKMPVGAKILDCQIQCGIPTLWAEIESGNEVEERSFIFIPTGGRMDDSDKIYIATLQSGGLVVHVYEEIG